jgi:hypothetical protein
MKKIALVIGTLVIAAVLVTVGWLLGARQHMLNQMFSHTLVDTQITEAVSTGMLLHHIDAGELDDARYSLRLKLDGNILFIDSLLPDSDQRTRDLAQKVFARIAAYRAEHPATYSGKFPSPGAEVDAKVAAILDRAQREQHK